MKNQIICGLYIGKIKKYIPSKSYIEVDLNEKIAIGDSIMIDSEKNKYNVSELILNGKNVKEANSGTVYIGRLKGHINIGDNVYKVFSKELSNISTHSFDKEYKKIPLSLSINIEENSPICLHIESQNKNIDSIYHNLSLDIVSDIIPQIAINNPITTDRIINQFSKTGNTEFEFKNININLKDNVFIPSISKLNELRRLALEKFEEMAINKFSRNSIKYSLLPSSNNSKFETPKISLLLNEINLDYNYSNLEHVDNIYIPFKYFLNKDYFDILTNFTANLYIYMPSIIRKNYRKLIDKQLSSIISNFKIKGFIISNLADLEILQKYTDFDIVGNYTLNVFNNYTISELHKLNIKNITLSPELSKLNLTENIIPYDSELIVYGNTPVMTANYCLLGKSNHCYLECNKSCNTNTKYYLKDRMNFKFRIIPDNISTVTTIFNSKTTSIPSNLGYRSYRIDILDEDIDNINFAISSVKAQSRLEGLQFTNGNFNREV